VESGREIRSYPTIPPERISAVALSPDGRLALTGSMAKTIRLWDVASGQPIRLLRGHMGDIRAVRFSPDGRLVLSASRDRTVRVWDLETGRELHAFAWAADATSSFDLSRDGRFALQGNEDGSMNFWDFDYVGRYRTLDRRAGAALATLRSKGDDASALATLGEWYAFRGVASWAIELLRRAERGGASVSPLMLARCYWQEGDLRAARRELERAATRKEAPADYLRLLIEHIGLSDQTDRLTQLSLDDGRVRYPFLGLRSSCPGGLPARGACVTHVFPEAPADLGGLRAGDVVIRADEQKIESDRALASYLASRSAGIAMALTYLRGDKTLTAEVILDERPSRLWQPDRQQVREPRSGWALQTVSTELAVSFGLDPATRGAVITEIGSDPSGPDTMRKVFLDDILVKVGGRRVTSAEEAAAAIRDLPPEGLDLLEIVHPGRVL
jgi:hypothetical protein